MDGPSNGGGPPERRPAVANPYLKRVPGGGSIGGGGGGGAPKTSNAARQQKQVVQATPAANPRKERPPEKARRPVGNVFDGNGFSRAQDIKAGSPAIHAAAHATPKLKMAQGPPSQRGPSGAGPRVTPTPKKARHHPQATTGAPKAAQTARAAATAAAANSLPRASMPQPVPRPAKPSAARRPGSLKSQLKSQIAALARQKKQFLQQKEAERQRAIQQKEMEKQRLLREKEMKRQAKLREQQRLKQEEEARKQLVEKCVNDMVARVEKRAGFEEKTGVHYAIGEAVEGIICNVEKRAAAEAAQKKNELQRAKEDAARRAMSEAQREWDELVRAYPYPTSPGGEEKWNLYWKKHPFVWDHRKRFLDMFSAIQEGSEEEQIKRNAFRGRTNYASPCEMELDRRWHNALVRWEALGCAFPIFEAASGEVRRQWEGLQAAYRGWEELHGKMDGFRRAECARPAVLVYGVPTRRVLPLGGGGTMPPPVHPPTDPIPTAKPAAPRTPAPPSVKEVLGLHPSPLADPHSPFVKSHSMLSADVVLTKKAAGDSFGVTLRYESKSALVPREEDAANAIGGAPAAVVPADPKGGQQPRKKRRKRVDFGVLMVVNADKATFAAGGALQHGDIILAVNGRSIGGTSFSEACKAISTTAAACAATGLIQSSLRVARMNAIPTVSPAALNPTLGLAGAVVGGGPSSSTPAMPMVPFVTSHPQFDFSMAEWASLIRGVSTLPHRLFTGMALTPVTQREVLDAIKKSEELGPSLQRRTVEAMEAKLAHESKRAVSEMTEKAGQYWVSRWMMELEGMTDAQRSMLRGAARPFKGCKCGSSTHERVDDPSCSLYADVRRYCIANSITIQADEKGAKKKVKEYKVKSTMEQAYVDRFRHQRAESAADKKEAEFVLEMEKIQSSRMKRAAFAPSSLCTMVLSAVASLADVGPGPKAEKGTLEETPKETPKKEVATQEQSDSDSDDSDSDSDDDDVPLTSLRQSGGKRTADEANPPASKRPKVAETESDDGKKAVPSPYILAELLKRMSETQGHLFAEPDHSEYAWQQRHRSTMTTPLPKEVMFKGSPREPGRLSFENIRLLLDGERMARLRQAWLSPTLQQQLPQPASQPDQNAARRWNDEWIVAHLSSDAITGLCHEINVLVALNILSVSASGRVSLANGWEKRVPQMVLNEMRDEWGPDVDRHNLHCIHEEVRSTLHEKWEHEEDGWRMIDSEELVFEDDEYQLRKQIFTENFSKWVTEKSGQGDFGV